MTNRFAPLPYVRVTCFSWAPLWPQFRHSWLDDIDGDDEELASTVDFCDDFSGSTVERTALDDVLGFTRGAVSLAFDDLSREDDVFEVKDGEIVIFEFVRCMGGNGVAERSDQLAKVGDGRLGHAQVYEVAKRVRFCCCLTFELSGPQRRCALDGKRKMGRSPSACWLARNAVGGPLE
jgi:hypothetical protein